MKSFLTWLVLGVILFLCSCQENRYRGQVYRPSRINFEAEEQLENTEPVISYSSEIDTFYNDKFTLSFEEDLQSFYRKVDVCAEEKIQVAGKLSAKDLYRALYVLNEPERAEDISPVRQLALRIKQSY